MNKNNLITSIVIIVILLIASGIIYSKNFQGNVIQDSDSEEVAKWIGEHSILYVQTGCIHCKEQEDLFGDNLKYLTIVDGATEEGRQKCVDAEIIVTPTWIINGQKYEEVLSIEKLKELTNYK